ncbi:hypothetical protein EYM_04155 [Ignicoccus islandicus DSM 13165]|uniref:Uncharacterized protein n=1 Tax=Ignicoccus islandicus DSM 13165 TaxID=940295 RepID=A0A0U3FRJ0_9CREN|nr:hypothetical protein [Ignicoccus islandicus]ALU12471.1 hypothetical protein EYM_04155 [Ignicoccus islandicus DSM 13165]
MAKLYSMTLQREVKVVFYNSNPLPFPFPKSEIPRIPIHKTDEVLISPREAAEDVALELNRKGESPKSILKLDSRFFEGGEASEYHRVLDSAFKVNANLLRKYSIASARVFAYSMALAGAYIARNLLSFNYDYLKGAKHLADTLFNGLISKTLINRSSKRIELPMRVKGKELVALLKAFALSYYILKKYESELGTQRLAEVEGEGLSLNEMELMSPHLSSFYKSVLESEINDYERKCVNENKGCDIVIDKGRWSNEECNISSPNPRHMKAHIGLEKNLVESRIDNGILRIRYRKLEGKYSKCWKKILDELSKPQF